MGVMKSLWLDRLSGKEPGWTATALAGLTNRSFLLKRGEDCAVLRLPGPGTERYIDRQAELHNHDLAAGLGIAPPILLADPDCLVTRYVEDAQGLTSESFRDPRVTDAVGRLLARLHQLENSETTGSFTDHIKALILEAEEEAAEIAPFMSRLSSLLP